MKKILAALLAAMMLLTLAACGGNSGTKTVDVQKLADDLKENVPYSAEMIADAVEELNYKMDPPEGTTMAGYIADGNAYDMIVVGQCASEEDAKTLYANVQTYVSDLKTEAGRYSPEEVARLDGALLRQTGTLVVLCVSEDKTPANDDADTPPITSGNDAQPGNTDDPNTADGDNTADDVTPTYQKIELKGDQQQYDAVYRVGDAGYEMYTYVDSTAKKYADNVNAVADALAGKATVYMLPVPLSSGISLPDELYGKDIFADQKDAEQKIIGYMNGNVKSVALYDALMAHRTEYVYFRTDHHWTATGAYYAYEQFCKAKGITPTPLSSYTVDEYDGFLGTFYRDSNQNAEMAANPDKVVAYHPLSTEATLDYVDNNGQTLRGKIIYDESDAPASLKYGTFITGDNSYSVINNPDVTDGSSCVVVKESFGNAFVPFLTDHYQTIHVIDYRYWKGSLSQFVTENNVQDVLFVNNLSAIRSTALVGYLHGIV